MNRCLTRHFLPAALLLALAAPLTAAAQDVPLDTQNEAAVGGRTFPPGTLRGKVDFQAPPMIVLDGQATRLSPGSRVQSAQRMLVPSAALAGQSFVVNYTRDVNGAVRDIWLLTPQEAATKRAGVDKPFFNFWPFASNAAPVDNSMTPYDQLPGYGVPGR